MGLSERGALENRDSVSSVGMDNDDSGVVFRYTDKNNFIRFHHTLDYEYNKDTKGGIKGGCKGKGSFLVVRKNGKETCLKTSGWKYTRNKFHTFRIVSKTNGQITIWVDGSKLMDVKNPAATNLKKGSVGIFVGHSQIQIKNLQYIITVPGGAKPPPKLVQKKVNPKFSDMVK